jgi:hypothetical protein
MSFLEILADGGHVGEETFTINVFLYDVNIADGGHVVSYRPPSTHKYLKP